MQSINNLASMLSMGNMTLKTGVVQQFVNGTVNVAIEGSVINLPVMDSVTLSLGQSVVCAVNGANGYVIGSLNGTTRSDSGWYTGGYGNPQPPDYSQEDPYTTAVYQVDAVSASALRNTTYTQSILGAADPYNATNSSVNGSWVHWYYGSGAFAPVVGTTVVKVEANLYTNRDPASGGNNSASTVWTLNTHLNGVSTTSAPSVTTTGKSGSYNDGTWVGWVDVTSQLSSIVSTTASFGIALSTGPAGGSNANIWVNPTYGSLRITYIN
jgi:hypothetical protein